jgi:predicted RNase H-like HicB family nuclease
MQFTIETEQETDGRWIAEVMEIPGVLKYGIDREDAIRQAEALALRVIAERIEAGEQLTVSMGSVQVCCHKDYCFSSNTTIA